MYLTGGQFKGHKIEVPKNTKPTLSKVRQGVFNMLNQFEFENKTFLDMFAGSGLIGLEAISRGYIVTQIEINPKSAKIIKSNYEKIKIKPNLILANSLNYKTDNKYEIIYIDPPWDENYTPIVQKACELLTFDGVIVIEYDEQRKLNINQILNSVKSDLKIVKSKKYGRCLIDILKKE